MYFTIQVTRTIGTCSKQIFDFPDMKAAKANHFYFLSSCYSNENLEYFMGSVVDEDGFPVEREVWRNSGLPPEVTAVPESI